MAAMSDLHSSLTIMQDLVAQVKSKFAQLKVDLQAIGAERDALKGQVADLQNQLAAAKAVTFPALDVDPEKQIVDGLAGEIQSLIG